MMKYVFAALAAALIAGMAFTVSIFDQQSSPAKASSEVAAAEVADAEVTRTGGRQPAGAAQKRNESQSEAGSAGDVSPVDLAYLHSCDAQDSSTCPAAGADSPEEAVWLLKHGYPTPEQLVDYVSMSTEDLVSGSEHDLAMQSLLGRRLVEEGEVSEGIAVMHDALMRGSVYALYEMSRAYEGQNEIADHIMSAAYLRLAYLMGDSQAGQALARIFERFGPVEMAMVDERAATLRQTMLQGVVVPPRP